MPATLFGKACRPYLSDTPIDICLHVVSIDSIRIPRTGCHLGSSLPQSIVFCTNSAVSYLLVGVRRSQAMLDTDKLIRHTIIDVSGNRQRNPCRSRDGSGGNRQLYVRPDQPRGTVTETGQLLRSR